MKIELIALILLTMLSCGQQEYDKGKTIASQSPNDTTQIKQHIVDSDKNDNKAIANINFYTSKPIAESDIRKFNANNNGHGALGNGYYIGDFNYISITPSFRNDSLYGLTISGCEITRRSVGGLLDVQFASITEMLYKKFGEPTYLDKYSQRWILGKKTIEVAQQNPFNESTKQVVMRIFITDISERVNEDQQKKYMSYKDSVLNRFF